MEEDETIMTFQPGETPAIAPRIGRSLKAVRERRRRIRNGSTVSGGQLKRGPRPFGIPREGIIDVRRAGLPEGWQDWPAKVCGRELFIFAPDGAVYGLGETGGER